MTANATAPTDKSDKRNGEQIWKDRLGGDVKVGKIMLAWPEQLVLVRDKAHPLWDPRVDMPIDEGMVLSMMLPGDDGEPTGVQEPIRVVAEGDKALVAKGRGRSQAAVEANRRLVAAGKQPFRVPVMPQEKASAGTQLARIIIENEIRRESNPMQRAWLLQRLLDTPVTHTDEGAPIVPSRKRRLVECRIPFGKSESTLRNWLDLLKCSPKVQAAIESGKLSARAAWEMIQSGVTDHAAQDKALPAMIAAGGKGEGARAAARGDDGDDDPEGGEGDGEGEGGGASKPTKVKAKVARSAKIWDRFMDALADGHVTGKVDQRALTLALAKWGRGDDRALREFPEIAALAKAALQPPKPKAKAAKADKAAATH